MIYIDMDDVVCESCVSLSQFARTHFDRNVQVHEMYDYDLRKSFSFDESTYRRYMKSFHTSELLDIPETPMATKIIRGWREDGLDPAIVTGRPTYSNAVTLERLEIHGLGGISVYHVDKYAKLFNDSEDPLITPFPALAEMDVKFAIEDAPNAIRMISGINLCPFAIFTRPWNRSYELPASPSPNYRISSWAELDPIVRSIVA